jgi:NADP-dependent 3-hydroxy acid dehydrogenase YdfG
MSSRLAIIGGGTLAQAIAKQYTGNVQIYTHDQFDITDQEQCNQLVSELATYDAVIITAGKISNDTWNMWMTNTVGPCYLVGHLNDIARDQRIVVVSSYAARWTSWPDVTVARLTYNQSKRAVSEFVQGLVQRGSANQLTVVEPSAFQSPMSDHRGATAEAMAAQIIGVLENPMHVITVTVR